MNKYEPPRRQLSQWSRLAHNRLQSFNMSGRGDSRLGLKTYCRDDLVESPKLNPNNHCH